MKSIVQWTLGLASVAPFLGMSFTIFVLPSILSTQQRLDTLSLQENLRLIFGLGGLLLTILYAVSVRRLVPADKRALWISILAFGNLLVLPFYWYWYLGPGSERSTSSLEPTG